MENNIVSEKLIYLVTWRDDNPNHSSESFIEGAYTDYDLCIDVILDDLATLYKDNDKSEIFSKIKNNIREELLQYDEYFDENFYMFYEIKVNHLWTRG